MKIIVDTSSNTLSVNRIEAQNLYTETPTPKIETISNRLNKMDYHVFEKSTEQSRKQSAIRALNSTLKGMTGG